MRKIRNISRCYATEEAFRDEFARFIINIGPSASGPLHGKFIANARSVSMYPSTVGVPTKIRFEVEYVATIVGTNSQMLLHVTEYEVNRPEESLQRKLNEYTTAFFVPNSQNDLLHALKTSRFENAAVIAQDDNSFFVSASNGSPMLTFSKTGLDKVWNSQREN